MAQVPGDAQVTLQIAVFLLQTQHRLCMYTQKQVQPFPSASTRIRRGVYTASLILACALPSPKNE